MNDLSEARSNRLRVLTTQERSEVLLKQGPVVGPRSFARILAFLRDPAQRASSVRRVSFTGHQPHALKPVNVAAEATGGKDCSLREVLQPDAASSSILKSKQYVVRLQGQLVPRRHGGVDPPRDLCVSH